MPWPTSQDYNEAVQNPQTSFNDPELRQGQTVCNALGIPQPCSGNFADVYAVECPATRSKWAVKCFTREVHGLRERYSEISAYLQQARLPFTVDFQYLEQGIRIAGRWYQVLKMHWVEGFTLNAFVRDNLDKPAKLDAMGRIWLRMARRLREANIAHCDLQHGNVLLVPDDVGQSLAVKLIDYDGMWVPALAGVPSGEVGHPAYQHPQRLREGTYGPEVDRFSLLVIYCAIRALEVGGRKLWERYDNGDNLLFRQQDFESPEQSPLFSELLRMNQAEVRKLAASLIDAAQLPIDQTPQLEELSTNGPGARLSAAANARSRETTPPLDTSASSYEEVAGAYSGREEPTKGRGLLMGALIGAAVLGLACLGLGTLFFAAFSGKLSTANQAANGKDSLKMVRGKDKPEANTPFERDRSNATAPLVKEKPDALMESIIYDANADFEAGWKEGANPNGVWRYGRTPKLRGPFTLFTRHHVPRSLNNLEQMWDDPNDSKGFTPSVARNSGGNYNDGNVTFQAGALILHPCGLHGDDYAHVIFTAPGDGSYALTGDFFAQQNNINVDVHVLVKSVSVFDSEITRNGISRQFSGTFKLSAGDMIDFAVGPNGNFVPHWGNTGLNAKITTNNNTEAKRDHRLPKPNIELQPTTVRHSKTVGGNGGTPFEEKGAQGAVLSGFAVQTRKLRGATEIAFLHPIYWNPGGRKMAASGIGWPKDTQAHPNVEAKDGYAIGGLQVWCNQVGGFQLVRGIHILFMRRRGESLDSKDSYWSEWIGESGKGQEVMIGGDGNPVTGIYGRAGGAIDSLGIIQLVTTDSVTTPGRTKDSPIEPDESTESALPIKHITNSLSMKLAYIAAGRFMMGSPPEETDRVGNENPRHTVEISRPFYLGVHTVTQDEYQQVMGKNPSYFSPSGGGKDKVGGLDTRRFPVEQVSWNEAVAFCQKLSGLEREKKAGRVYRLPTEAEWEYACRAGTTTRFFFGERLSAKNANFDATRPYGGENKEVSYGGGEKGPTLGRTAAVGSYPKNRPSSR
jgi:serine/threonine protein kinase